MAEPKTRDMGIRHSNSRRFSSNCAIGSSGQSISIVSGAPQFNYRFNLGSQCIKKNRRVTFKVDNDDLYCYLACMQDTNFRTQKKQILSHQGTFKTPWLPGMGLAGLSGCDSSPRSWMGAAPGRRAPLKASFSSGTFQTPLLSLSPKLSALLNIPRRWHPEPIWYFHLSFVFSLITSLLSSVPGNPPHPGSGTSPLPLPAPPRTRCT